MEKDIRRLGIEVINNAPWGTHLCQFYKTKEDLIDILVPYFKAGLDNNEFCMWVTSAPLETQEAKVALKKVLQDLDDYIEKGQLEILDAGQWYTKSGNFEPDRVLEGWVEKEKQAITRGFDGLRLTGNTFWLEKKDWRDFADYEATVDDVIGKAVVMIQGKISHSFFRKGVVARFFRHVVQRNFGKDIEINLFLFFLEGCQF